MPYLRSFCFSIDLCLIATLLFNNNTSSYILSDRTCKGGGHLSVEDATGHVNCTFLEDGFFDYLNKVVYDAFYFF